MKNRFLSVALCAVLASGNAFSIPPDRDPDINQQIIDSLNGNGLPLSSIPGLKEHMEAFRQALENDKKRDETLKRFLLADLSKESKEERKKRTLESLNKAFEAFKKHGNDEGESLDEEPDLGDRIDHRIEELKKQNEALKNEHSPGGADKAGRAGVNEGSIFKKFKQRHAETIASLKEAAETLQRLQKEKNNPPTIIMSVALASELLRLKQEESLIAAWEDGTLPKKDYITLMAENTFILDHLKMFAAFTKSTYAAWENRTGVVTEAELMRQAAEGFDTYYTEKDKRASAFYDVELREAAKEGRKTLDTFKKIFAADKDAREIFRTIHFPGYAEQLVTKNEKLIRDSAPKPKP